MFYAHMVLAKKGPLARIWLAAHWDKKLTKAHVFETNIEQSVEGIMQPKVKLALRTSGHLLLGVVRIYSRKAKYLLADCNEAFVKIKMAFRPGMVDLPEEYREANVNAITLPEVFHDFDSALPELNDVDIEAQFSINQSRADEITMREEYGSLPMSIHDDGFGDMGFDADEADLIRDVVDTMDDNYIPDDMDHDIDHTRREPMPGTSRSMLDSLDNDLHDDNGFGDNFGQPAVGLFEGDLFSDAPVPPPILESCDIKDSIDDMNGGWDGDADAPSPAPSSVPSRPPSVTPTTALQNEPVLSDEKTSYMLPDNEPNENNMNAINQENQSEQVDEHLNEQTILNNEEESFALAPVDTTVLKGVTRAKRKRKLIVDEVKNISGEEMKSQLANTSDIITTLDLAPPTKRLMYWKETGGVEKLFALPSRDIPARCLFKGYQRHLTSRPLGFEDFSMLGPTDILVADLFQQEQDAQLAKRGRKRKLPAPPVPPAPEFEQPIPVISTPPVDQQEQLPDHQTTETLMNNESLLPPETSGYNDQSVQLRLSSAVGNMPMTPGNLLHGDNMTPHQLEHCDSNVPPTHLELDHMASSINVTHTDLAPLIGLEQGHSDFQPSDIHPVHHPSFTPVGLEHGGITPSHHGIENLETIPNLPADQVSSILNDTGMENIGFTNMGYDEPPSQALNRCGDMIANDWNEDYEFPPSVPAPQPGDEQMENETDEQFEERVLNKRAAQMFVSVKARLQKKDSIYLSEMTIRNNRKQAAQKFYSLLVLKKFQALEIKQEETYGDILVTKGVLFDNPKL